MSSTSSPFGQNEWLVEEMYRKFRDDPSSVDPSWHEFLVDYNPEPTTDSTAGDYIAITFAITPLSAFCRTTCVNSKLVEHTWC